MRIGRISAGALALAVAAAGLASPEVSAQSAPPRVRIAGADRYATAAALSQHSFGPGTPVAVIATGEGFADALAGTPAAARARSPILLTRRDSIPGPTDAELRRLRPSGIVVLGGPAVVSDAVVGALAGYTTGHVVRAAGPDRYATSAAIARSFPPDVPVVYLASGNSFPDALAGGPAAAAGGGPLLLVEHDRIPHPVQLELERLRPARIVVLGSVRVVSDFVERFAGSFAPSVTRHAGFTRYATAALTSAGAFAGGAGTVYLATGENFPDALAAGPIAAANQAPVLPVRQHCIPAEVRSEIDRLGPSTIVIVGGEGSVSASVAALAVCPQPAPPTLVTFAEGGAVGTQIPPGTYRTLHAGTDHSCRWSRRRGISDTQDDVIGGRVGKGNHVATIAPTDGLFTSQLCGGVWTNDLSPITSSPDAPFGDGTWIVGVDVAPGRWKRTGGSGLCHWARLAGFGGETGDQIEAMFDVFGEVVIRSTDAGFATEECGTWSRIG